MIFGGKLLYFLCIYCSTILSVESFKSYQILGVFPFHSKSHNIMFEQLMKGLALRGHKVDVITHFELKNPPNNYRTIINFSEIKHNLLNLTNNIPIDKIVKYGMPYNLAVLPGNNICRLLSTEKMQQFIKNPPNKYDLIITEAFAANCYFGLGFALKAPVITVSTMMEFPWTFNSIRNPDSTAFIANAFFESSRIETFFDRLRNTITVHLGRNKFYQMVDKTQTELMRKYLSPDISNIREVEKNVALMFTNCHHTFSGVRPLSPAIISIAGLHVEQNTDELPLELKKWMDDSVHGVIYFTFGSMFLIESLPRKVVLKFYAAFSKISPVRVLMKVADVSMLPPGLPENVLTSAWLPQIPILKHNNTRVFMTHGGMMGSQEALFYSVPLIGFPQAIDQFINIDVFVRKHMAIQLDHETMTTEHLINSLNLILSDPSYKNAAVRESRIFRDRPMSAMETAIFWVEYIIRNGPSSLKSPAIDLHWWQVELLDVYAFLIISFIIISYIFLFLITRIILLLFKLPKHAKKDE